MLYILQCKKYISCTVLLFISSCLFAQVLSLKDAINTGVSNYGTIKAKANYANASLASVSQSKKEALPNFIISAQNDYGTVNGQNGPLYGLGGYGVASSGLPLPNQNWNAAFGALYLANINWDFFTFGRVKERIKTAQSVAARDLSDQQQEIFQHQIRIAAAYLNLLAAQRITFSQQKNLNRADTFRYSVISRVKNGLIAGVDSSLANAEVSNAKIALIRSKDAEQEKASQLAQLMGIDPQLNFVLDTLFISKIPKRLSDSITTRPLHPLLQYYQNRINLSNEQAKYFNTQKYPTLTLFGIFQTRGSGFQSNYATDQHAFNQSYIDGIKPVRSNYLLGVGLTWNLTSLLRINQQVASQKFVSQALNDEYKLIDLQLKSQQALSNTKMENAINTYFEAPTQVKAASDAYLQKNTLYSNGLTTIVEVTQTLYILNRAETDRDIAYSNVWQALLLKAAAAGDMSLFLNEF